MNEKLQGKSSAPTVSVVIPTYNSEKTIERALSSLLRQSFKNFEVILVDDVSDDRTVDVATQFNQLPIRIFINTENLGAAAARNLGVKHALGQYVAFLDSDDEWLPTKLERQLNEFANISEGGFISCEAAVFDENGNFKGPNNPGRARPTGDQAWKSLLAYTSFHTSTIVANREAIVRAGGFNEDLPTGEDQDLWIRLAMIGPIGHLDEVLVKVYATPRSVSHKYRRSQHKYLLPLVRNYVKQHRGSMSKQEINLIFRHRFFDLGKDLCIDGYIALGGLFLLRSIGRGASLSKALELMLSFSYPGRIARTVKNKVRQSTSP